MIQISFSLCGKKHAVSLGPRKMNREARSKSCIMKKGGQDRGANREHE
jgi:hypothetical protein